MTLSEPLYKKGDQIIYYDNDDYYESMNGDTGVITEVIRVTPPSYTIKWTTGKFDETTESENYIRLNPNYYHNSETLRDIADYLSLDAVESSIVQSWVKELRKHDQG